MLVRLISSEGAYLEALVEIDGRVLCVMDEFSTHAKAPMKPGDSVPVELEPLFHEYEPWESIMSGNPKGRIGLEPIRGWSYRAFGKVVSVNPVRIDCGLFVAENVFQSHDVSLIGSFVSFTVARLSASYSN